MSVGGDQHSHKSKCPANSGVGGKDAAINGESLPGREMNRRPGRWKDIAYRLSIEQFRSEKAKRSGSLRQLERGRGFSSKC